MNLKDLVEFTQKSLSSYVRDFGALLVSPRLSGINLKGSTELHPSLWVFLIISVFIAWSLTSLTPISGNQQFAVAVVVVLSYWFAVTVLSFLQARVFFDSDATFVETANGTLRVLAVTYVLSSFAALLASTILMRTGESARLLGVATVFWMVQLSTLAAYVALVVSGLSELNGRRTAGFALVLAA